MYVRVLYLLYLVNDFVDKSFSSTRDRPVVEKLKTIHKNVVKGENECELTRLAPVGYQRRPLSNTEGLK
jgi:hypothetical protein